MLVEVGEFSTARGRSKDLLDRVKADIAALGGTDAYAPAMRVGYSCDVAVNVEELEALLADLSVSSIVVIALVLGVIVFYYRWWRSVLVLFPPLFLAAGYSFALASLPPFGVTELNSNTAFLGSILLGNGINFGIVVLARYVEERRAGQPVNEALAVALSMSRPGTLAAALAAGVSYASLVATDFRGFRQFGIIGGIGMVVSWAAAYVLFPPLVAWVDRGAQAAPKPLPARGGPMDAVSRFVVGYPRAIALVAGALTLAAMWTTSGAGAQNLESDFSKLRRADTWTNGDGYWSGRMDDLLGTYLTPTVVLTDDVDQARAIATDLREAMKRPPLDGLLASVRTLDDVLPADQAAHIELANAIREDMTPKMRSLMPEDKRATIERFLDGAPSTTITLADLPPSFTTGLRENDGTIGHAVLLYPKLAGGLWEGPTLAAFVGAVRNVAAAHPGPKARGGRVAGSLPLSADILDSIRRDGAKASAIALAGVVAVVVLLFRTSSTSALVVGSLLVGVLWLGALTMALHVKINFANFIAFPITFGIGVDYAVNVMSRYVSDGDVGGAVRSTGGAVTLCSLTTIIGYSSLLLAQNRALFLFGLVAVLGEVACLTAGVVVLPAVVASLRRAREPSLASGE
jgi:predicted exporter